MIKCVTSFPCQVREIEHCSIPLKDRTQLAARIWLPEDAEASPVPAIFEYIPYRKGDVTAYVDSLMHPYFAGHGYAALRVDIRGSGESDGVLIDEYGPQEHDDALARTIHEFGKKEGLRCVRKTLLQALSHTQEAFTCETIPHDSL